MCDFKIVCLIFCVSNFYYINTENCLNQDIIAAFMKNRKLITGTIFYCTTIKDNLQLFKNISNEFKINLLPMVENFETGKLEFIFLRKYRHIGVIVDGCCQRVNELMIKYSLMRAMYDTYKWLIISNIDVNFDVLFRNVNSNLNADVHVAILNVTSDSYDIYDVYNQAANHSGVLKVIKVGNYSLIDGYNVPYLGNKFWLRRNMTGVRFKSALVMPPSINTSVSKYLDNDEDRDIESQHRFQGNAIRHCQHMYNFSLDVISTDSWGYLIKDAHNGSFDGMVGLLQRREIDFGSSPLINKYDRIPVVDYSYGNWILKSAFIYRPPKGTTSSLEIFLRPFTWSVWLCVLALAIFVATALKYVIGFEWTILSKYGAQIETAWSYMILYVIAAFSFQGMEYQPNLASARMFIIFLFVFSILLYQFYAGYLVSYLLMEPPREINNIADLLRSSLRAGIEDILIDRDYFVQTTDPSAIGIFRKKVNIGNQSGFYLPPDGLELVRKGGFAFHVETSTAYPIILKTFPPKMICELEEVQMYHTQPMHTNLQKRSPFKEMLNLCMLKLVEAGQMVRLRHHWDTHKPECIAADHTLDITVGLSEFWCALLVLGVGGGLSLIFLAFELYYRPDQDVQVKQKVNKEKTKAANKKAKKGMYIQPQRLKYLHQN